MYGMMGYNLDGTYRTGPADRQHNDPWGRTPEQIAAEQEQLRAIMAEQDAQRAARAK